MATEIPIESVTIGDTTYERWPERAPLRFPGGVTVEARGPVFSGFSTEFSDPELAGRWFEKYYGITSDEFQEKIARSQRRLNVYAQAEAILAGERQGFGDV